MDSPIHPDLRPTTIPVPFPIRNEAIIHGHDIELAPAPFQERVANPPPEVIQHPTHSTLELAKLSSPLPQPYPHPLPIHQEHRLLPVHPDIKAWGSRPNSIYTDRSHSAAPTSGPISALPGQRYSETDFSSPFDRRPLVPSASGGEGKPPRERICGIRRQLCWVGLAVGIFLVVVAVAVGVGVGLGTSRNEGSSTPSPTPSSTRTFPVPVATSAPSASISCPGNNLTLYTASQYPQKKYLLLCGRDYNSNLGTTQDMYNQPTDTLTDCINLCAGQEGCVGAGWGRGSTGGAKAICWLKSRLGAPNNAPAWSFVVEDPGT